MLVKDVAKSSGYWVAAIQESSQFKHTHAFLLEAWEAPEKHLDSDGSTGETTQMVLGMMQSALSDPCIKDKILPPQQFFHSLQYLQFFSVSEADTTCKSWLQVVCHDALAYLGLYLAICGGNWNL